MMMENKTILNYEKIAIIQDTVFIMDKIVFADVDKIKFFWYTDHDNENNYWNKHRIEMENKFPRCNTIAIYSENNRIRFDHVDGTYINNFVMDICDIIKGDLDLNIIYLEGKYKSCFGPSYIVDTWYLEEIYYKYKLAKLASYAIASTVEFHCAMEDIIGIIAQVEHVSVGSVYGGIFASNQWKNYDANLDNHISLCKTFKISGVPGRENIHVGDLT
jgi:hypothetical protein